MRTYAVYAPNGDAPRTQAGADSLVFVKEGFHWLAFLAPAVWLLCCRAWLGLAVWIAGVLAIGALDRFGVGETADVLLSLLLGLLIGFEASWFRQLSLRRRCFRMIGAASGDSQADAERAYFARWLDGGPESPAAAATPPRTAMPRLGGQPVLGVFPPPDGRR